MITQLPYLCGHNVGYRAGLDKCGGVTVNTIRLHVRSAHMACDDPKGVVIMTKRAESATSSKHRKEGELTREELETLSSVLAKMFRDASARGRQDPFLGEEEILAEE